MNDQSYQFDSEHLLNDTVVSHSTTQLSNSLLRQPGPSNQIKLYFNGDLKAIKKVSTFDALLSEILKRFDSKLLRKDLSQIRLTYLDSDEDTITIGTDEDLVEALDQISMDKTLRITVSVRNASESPEMVEGGSLVEVMSSGREESKEFES
jgi:hypothetical protein